MARYRVVLPLARHGIIVPVGAIIEIEPAVAADPAVAHRVVAVPDPPQTDPPKTPDPTPDQIAADSRAAYRKQERVVHVAAAEIRPAQTKAEQE